MAKIAKTHEDIEAQILEIQGMKAALVEGTDQGVGLDSTGFFDQEIYGGSDSRFAGYVTSIAANEQEEDDDEDSSTSLLGQKKPGYHAPVAILNSIPQSDEQYDPFAEHRPQKISDREDEYKKRRQKMIISPERHDPFADGKFLHHHVFPALYMCPCRSVFILLLKFCCIPALMLFNPSNITQQLASLYSVLP